MTKNELKIVSGGQTGVDRGALQPLVKEEEINDKVGGGVRMKVSIVSFSYPHGVPEDVDDDYWGGFVFDCRSMPDPHGEVSLRGYSGLDKPVIDFFAQHRNRVDRFLDAAEALVRQTIEAASETGRDYLQVAFGCYGGHHRSVYLAERFAERLAGTDSIEIVVTHSARQYWNA